jgi:AhpD family alkylhydroperoxidase
MKPRANYGEVGQKALKSLYPLGGHLAKSPVGKALLDLICMRLSQVNGCAYCLDMHAKDLRELGEPEQRLYTLNAWRDTPFFSDKERAALAFAEAVNSCQVPDTIYEETAKYFTDEELVDLTLNVGAINLWNRLNHVFHPLVGTYEVGQFA